MCQDIFRCRPQRSAFLVFVLFLGNVAFSSLASTLEASSFAAVGDSQRASIFVQLPASAQLYMDDVLLKQTGERRHFVTPPLEQGFTYSSTLRMELPVEGGVFRATRRIDLRAGQTIRVDFGIPAPPVSKAPSATKQPAPPGQAADADGLSRTEAEVLRLTNKERQDAGLGMLSINSTLTKAARQHSANMARQGKMDHVLDEKGPTERLRALGYSGLAWGENIAFGMPTPAEVVRAWMNSEGHRANILNGTYNEIGIGIATDERGVPYYTQVFGRSGK